MRNLKVVYVLIMLVVVSCFIGVSFSLYKKHVDMDYTAYMGEMICEFELESDDNFVENGVKYFKVTVKNYKEEYGSETLTAMNGKYSLTITNKAGSHGLYKCVKAGVTDDVSEFSSNYTTGEYTLGASAKQEDVFLVFVKLDDSISEEHINVDVCLNAEQVEKVTSFGSL